LITRKKKLPLTTNGKKILVEVCVDSVESAIEAERGGAQRIELCDNLFEGGTTPSFGMISTIKDFVKIPINVIIRPRGGDFHYSRMEFEVMKRDIILSREFGVNGIVTGILNEDGSVDKERMKILINLARPLSITFHRAFDMTNDPFKTLNDIIKLGIERILTSGCENSAYEGSDLIKELIKTARNKIIIMPGGGINERNISSLVSKCKPREIHIGGAEYINSSMIFRKNYISMGKSFKRDEYAKYIINSERIKRITG
jgi:copper homeostasis protein